MRKLIIWFFAFVVVVASLPVSAQGLSTLAEIRKVTDSAMEKVGRGDIEAGLKTFRHLTIIPAAEFDAMLGQLPMQVPGMSSRFGASIGYEFIKEDKVGESLARFTYINKFERHATRWYFYCYKGKSGWVVNTFRFDDKLHELF